jgi:hypothetical protein
MSKRANKEREKKAALRLRLKDMASGAYGGYHRLDFDGEDFTGMASEMGLDAFGRWVGAIGNELLDDAHKYLTEPRNLEHFDSLDKAVDLLWEHGIRA